MTAGVADHSTLVATTVQLAPGLEFWEGVGLPWRVLLPACAERAERAVTTNILIRDMDVARPNPLDMRRLEVVADGLPLFGGRQLALDTTLVSSLHCDGSPQPGAANRDGAVLDAARRRKNRTYPELIGPPVWLCWLVMSVEGGQRKLVPS